MTRFSTKVMLLIAALGIAFMGRLSCKEKQKPNIIILFADDISARELPVYGSSVWSPPPQGGDSSDPRFRAQTPVLDRLAHEGVWIKTVWASTVCSPSRAMMMTGRYAHIHKWWNNKDKGTWVNPEGKEETYPLYASSPYSLGEIAKAGGYATYWAGKTQMAGVDRLGFDEGCFTPGVHPENNPYTDFRIVMKKKDRKKVLVNEDTGDEVNYYQQYGWYWKPHVELMNHPSSKSKFEIWPNTPEARDTFGLNTFGPDVELDFVFDFMERKHREGKPFFIYHTTHLGHDGWDFFSRETDPNKRQKWPGTPKIEWKNGRYYRTAPNVTGNAGNYNTHGTVTEGGIHRHINYIDYQVWLYMKELEKLEEADNTIFIFTADNGTSKYGKNSPVSQRGTHVPMIIYAPCLNMARQGEQDILVNLSDVLPTVAELAGVQIPDSYEINGVSLLPYLQGRSAEHRSWIYSYHKGMQLIRGEKILIDGHGTIYNASHYPADLISFPKIKDVNAMPAALKAEYDVLKSVLPRYNVHDTEHDAPKQGIGKLDPLKILE